ncbi:hypothetical protein OG21DRAFT_1488841 [Imleria badia]|nr:hypothetical protein OG21DRAFT_1488841 [Imleria badia]
MDDFSTLPSNYRQDELQIGDVGYVSRDGAFEVLLNIRDGPNHALHRRLGLSFSIDPIALDIGHEVISNVDPHGSIITSPGVTQPSQTSQRDGHYDYTSSANGAIPILSDGETFHTLLATERFRKVAMKHAFDWYKIAKEHYGECFGSDSLYLVTGVSKARSCSLTHPGGDYHGTFPFPVQYRDAPGRDGNVNQTVFISGFKIAVRDDVLGWISRKLEANPAPVIRSRKGLFGFARFLMRLFGKKNTSKRPRKGISDADVNHVPALSQPFHPSNIINRYLLSKFPDALVAVTHDSEWISFIDTGELTSEELMQEDRLERFLSKDYSLVSQPENSAVYLQGKIKDVNSSVLIDARRTFSKTGVQQEVSSKPEEFWSTSTDNFQVVITRVRAEDVTAGFRRMPIGFYVLVQFDGTRRRTENKPVHLYNSVVEWDHRIQLPSEPSAKVQFSVCACFEFSPMLGDGEILRTVEICVGDLLDNTRLITFSPTEGELSPCSSLLITMERQPSHDSGAAPDHDADFGWEESSELAQLTDQGHSALLRYRDDPRKEHVTASVGYFEHALSICPNDHRCYAVALCNLGRAHFIQCQINRSMELSTTISYYREALELRPVGHPDRPGTLLRLAEVLLYCYGKVGFEEFPGEIVTLASEVQACCSEDSHECRAADLTMQTYALYKAISSGSLADIDKSILGLRQAVQDIPEDYFDKLQRLSNLALALWIRYVFHGDLGDLDESILIHEEAMRFTPYGLNSPTHTALLKERENVTLAGFLWKDALVTADSFGVPRLSIYRALCERLEMLGRGTDAIECFRQMVEWGEETNRHGEYLGWVLGASLVLRQRFSKELECLGDAAVDAQRFDDAISRYTTAFSLNLPSPQGILIKRSKAFLAMGSWKQALNDANLIITLDPSSPRGYEMKHAALHNAGDYDNAVDALEEMLSKMAQSPDPNIERSPRVLIDIATGRLRDRAERASAFEALPIFNELVSSMTTHIDYVRIKHEVRQYFRYVMLSHKWEENEPLFQQVLHIAVYDLDQSPTHDKLQTFCKIVREAGFNWAWSDTCCINKSDHSILQEALVAMFKWYQGSALMIVYLRGVCSSSQRGALVRSIWNTRGWTLQEYVASKIIHFYTEDWTLYLDLRLPNHKESPEVILEMEEATGVSAQQLMALRPGLSSIREKLRLASTRKTTLVEDTAYSLLGIFLVTGISPLYGQGERSLGHLLAHVLTGSGDVSILAWTGESGRFNSCLPADITVFNGPTTSHLPAPIPDAEMESITTALHSSSFDLDIALRLYNCLDGLSVPCLLGRENMQSGGFVEDDISIPPSLNTDDGELSNEQIDDDAPSLTEPESPSLPAPVHPIPMDRDTGARRLVARLKQRFGALLVTLATTGRAVDYRRVAADSLITVQFRENVSLAEILDNVRVLDIL